MRGKDFQSSLDENLLEVFLASWHDFLFHCPLAVVLLLYFVPDFKDLSPSHLPPIPPLGPSSCPSALTPGSSASHGLSCLCYPSPLAIIWRTHLRFSISGCLLVKAVVTTVSLFVLRISFMSSSLLCPSLCLSQDYQHINLAFIIISIYTTLPRSSLVVLMNHFLLLYVIFFYIVTTWHGQRSITLSQFIFLYHFVFFFFRSLTSSFISRLPLKFNIPFFSDSCASAYTQFGVYFFVSYFPESFHLTSFNNYIFCFFFLRIL